MAINKNQFLVSVCDAVLRDTTADAVVLKGKALINSAFKQTLATQEVRAGKGNALQYIYQHDKKLDITVEAANFDESFVAINNGTSIVNGVQNYYVIDEPVVLTAGAGVTSKTPVGSVVYVQKADFSLQTITSTGSNFTVSGGANTTVLVTYRVAATVDSITIDASLSPNSYELTLSSDIFEGTGKTATLQIIIPNYKPTGNYDLSFTASGVSTNRLEGMALVNQADNAYAYFRIIPVSTAATSYIALAATPSNIALSATVTTQQLSVYGIRGGLQSNVLISSGLTYSSSAPSFATVNATGLVTRVAAGTTYVTSTLTSSGQSDVVQVTVT